MISAILFGNIFGTREDFMTITPIARTLYNGLLLNEGAEKEQSADRFEQLYLFPSGARPVAQLAELFAAWSPALEAWEAAGNAPIVVSNVQRIVLNLTPLFVAVFVEAIPNETVKNVFRWGQRQIGRVFCVAFTVSHVALYYFKGSQLALLALGVQAVGVLHQSGLLPRRVSKVLSQVAPVALDVAAIVVFGPGNLFGLQAAFHLASPVLNYAWTSKVKPFLEAQVPEFADYNRLEEIEDNQKRIAAENQARPLEGKLDASFADPAYLNQLSNLDLSIGVNHLKRGSLPCLLDASPQNLLDIWDDLNDPRLTPAFRRALEAKISIWKTWNPQNEIGGRYLQHIAAELPKKSTEMQVQTLLQLANALPQDHQPVIENAFSRLFNHGPVLPLNWKIYHRLQDYRTKVYFANHRQWGAVAPLGLAYGVPEDRTVKFEDFESVGYTLPSLKALITDAEAIQWRDQQCNEVRTALAVKTPAELKLYMLMSYRILYFEARQ